MTVAEIAGPYTEGEARVVAPSCPTWPSTILGSILSEVRLSVKPNLSICGNYSEYRLGYLTAQQHNEVQSNSFHVYV